MQMHCSGAETIKFQSLPMTKEASFQIRFPKIRKIVKHINFFIILKSGEKKKSRRKPNNESINVAEVSLGTVHVNS